MEDIVLMNFFVVVVRALTLQPGKALSHQKQNKTKMRFVREPGKAKWPSWIFYSPYCLNYSYCLLILNPLI